MTTRHASLTLPSPDATCALAQRIGAALGPGDVLLLSGEIGAGKTHFARCLIQSLLDTPEDVPSPTFTLVQTYDTTAGELWHADLYRLTGPDESIELGLTEAFDSAICLVEWPDRLEDLTPSDALHLHFTAGADDDSRSLTLDWQTPRWDDLASGCAG
ncbi:tRNA (adenosine(37)-N6)-threonylcarbamoyltransferase complex ATPase subunit type 1 TsaE [Mameliella alba]|nr:tRNA (adenosine(37)-N6)-threonylcarbamoyltransferase complex ATPase subunit type 1 TsaE [Antarctobacter heliothermus]MBY6142693.1 tRNA (adenosine(37)-N6)-threonylcarbamoyltransferase complex ATPase subunit type 1 TsaE [Mameliella alba]MCA0953582.1 tRNA (adenosine(37)-N6)-threonylcarbamoyltransferase complex ATPase subunit type 1 TsaE [Mameliella alba]